MVEDRKVFSMINTPKKPVKTKNSKLCDWNQEHLRCTLQSYNENQCFYIKEKNNSTYLL